MEVCSRGVVQAKGWGGGRSEGERGRVLDQIRSVQAYVGPSTTGVCGTQSLPAQHNASTNR